ncbi:MAG: hypothetical protein ACFCUI_07615 [Bernardetiaceae bacterium]
MKQQQKIIGFIVCTLWMGWEGLAQNRTYLGFELSATNDLPSLTGVFERNMNDGNFVNGVWGFYLGQEIGRGLVLETGFLQKNIPAATPPLVNIPSDRPRQPMLFRSGQAFEVWQIPLRLRTQLLSVGKRLGFFSRIGYRLNLHTGGAGYQNAPLPALNDPEGQPIDCAIIYEDVRRNFSVFEVGLGMEWTTFDRLSLTLHGSYFGGFQDIQRLAGYFLYADGQIRTGSLTLNGSYFNVGFTLAYPVSLWWRKERNGA